jgi:hypothetical protein
LTLDSAAVINTIFMMPATAGMPSFESTVTNGLPAEEYIDVGSSMTSSNTEPT